MQHTCSSGASIPAAAAVLIDTIRTIGIAVLIDTINTIGIAVLIDTINTIGVAGPVASVQRQQATVRPEMPVPPGCEVTRQRDTLGRQLPNACGRPT